MSCRISMAQVRREEIVGWEAAEEFADGAVRAGVDKPRAGRAADCPICSGWFGGSFQSGELSRHSEELRPVQVSPLPSSTPSNGRNGQGFKNRPTRKFKVTLLTCRRHPASSNIAGRVVDDCAVSRKEIFPDGTGKDVSIFQKKRSLYELIRR